MGEMHHYITQQQYDGVTDIAYHNGDHLPKVIKLSPNFKYSKPDWYLQ